MHAVVTSPAGRDQPLPGPERMARLWAKAIARTSYVPMNRRELIAYLTEPAAGVLAAMTVEPFDPAPAKDAGAALVAGHLTQPASLEKTLAMITQVFEGFPAERLGAVQGALAAGFAQAQRDRILADQ